MILTDPEDPAAHAVVWSGPLDGSSEVKVAMRRQLLLTTAEELESSLRSADRGPSRGASRVRATQSGPQPPALTRVPAPRRALTASPPQRPTVSAPPSRSSGGSSPSDPMPALLMLGLDSPTGYDRCPTSATCPEQITPEFLFCPVHNSVVVLQAKNRSRLQSLMFYALGYGPASTAFAVSAQRNEPVWILLLGLLLGGILFAAPLRHYPISFNHGRVLCSAVAALVEACAARNGCSSLDPHTRYRPICRTRLSCICRCSLTKTTTGPQAGKHVRQSRLPASSIRNHRHCAS